MNNLEKFGSQELNRFEMRETNGGLVCGGFCIAAMAFAAGAAAGAYATRFA